MALVSKLQDENRRLRDELERNSDLHNKSDLTNSIETISMFFLLFSLNHLFCFH